jgi:hypothetical protein
VVIDWPLIIAWPLVIVTGLDPVIWRGTAPV